MGNQGSSGEGVRLSHEWLWNGEIGDVTKVEAITDRPLWPQALVPAGYARLIFEGRYTTIAGSILLPAIFFRVPYFVLPLSRCLEFVVLQDLNHLKQDGEKGRGGDWETG